ncbi:hypothetical protein GPALN_001927 [Globodera pallida]|nr:hypothetical protein GPALN_001927 [Globodera pallida]
MEDMLFRFLYNIPANEKENQIRVCFHIELAHWFFLDFYCADNPDVPERLRTLVPCQQVGFAQFVRQVFHKCDFLEKWRHCIDKIISEFHYHKSHVPTYGVIMLDPTLSYILLVQGYYASKNSWGFPKGKINEDEVPLGCALREAFEEVGFDASEHIKNPEKCRPLQHFFGETLVRLFLATDVPMDFPFKPHLRKEIRKICWFFLHDLPKYHKDNDGCTRLGNGLTSNCFNSIIPFTKDICEFVERERRERNKPKCTVLKTEPGSVNSAFQPVIPRASSQQKLNTPSSSNAVSAQPSQPSTEEPTTSRRRSTVENLFKPLKPDPANQHTSFTGQSFLNHIGAAKHFERVSAAHSGNSPQIPTNPAGVIGSEAQFRRSKEIKHPKPMHPTGPVVVVYEAPQEHSSPDNATQKDATQPTATPKDGNEIADMLRSSMSKMGRKQREPQRTTATTSAAVSAIFVNNAKAVETTAPVPLQKTVPSTETVDFAQLAQFVPTQVRRCEAWKKFTLDRTRLQPA